MLPSEPEIWLSTFNVTPSVKEVRVTPFTKISPLKTPPKFPPILSFLPLIRFNSDCSMDISHRLAKPIPQPDDALHPKNM